MLILGIDTCGLTAACALWQDGEILSEVSFKAKKTHSQVILPLVKKMLSDADKTLSDVDVFAAVKGPGSYTGLRIGIAAVQGICFALDKPCVGVSALEALAENIPPLPGFKVCTLMHARKDLYYTALFEEGKRCMPDSILSADELYSLLEGEKKNIICISDTDDVRLPSGCTRAPKVYCRRSGASLCSAAAKHDFCSAELLLPEYLQPTKAEKDLSEKA